MKAQKEDVEKVDAECKKLKEENKRDSLNGLASRIDETLLKKINHKLDSSRPDDIISLLETFVALLRNKTQATHVDVKLYLQDHAKLQFKLRTIEATKLDHEVVTKHANALNDKLGKKEMGFTDPTADNWEYNVFYAWADSFAHYAEYFLDQKDLHEQQAETRNNIANLE